MARTVGRILLTLTGLAITGFLLLVLIGLFDRHEQEITAGLSRIYQRYLASQADPSSNPRARAAVEAERAVVGRGRQVAMTETFQDQPKLVGTGAVGSANQGMAVALSADGNTAIVGGPGANNADRDRPASIGPAGAAWVFTQSGGVWRQQAKLVGTTSEYGGGLWSQGASVAVSADGNTAIVGGWSDNSKTGAAWVFTRSGAIWTQQGKKLVGTDALGSARQGMSVALSADGNTAIVGGPGDNPWDRSVPFGLGAAGAAWVFTRSGGVWTQQNKLVSTGAVGRLGTSIALSADGNIAIVGGFAEDGGVALVFTRGGGQWTQDKRLVGAGAIGKSAPSVALSTDGSVVILGASNDNGGVGAAWVFTRSGGYWSQDKHLVGSGAAKALPSASVDSSVDMVGRSNDNSGAGAATVFTQRGGGSDSQELARPSAPSDPAVSFEE